MNFWRNSFVSLSSILIMSVTLLVIGCVIFTGVTLKASLAELEKKVDINVYFMDTAPESDVLEIKKSLEALPEVLAVEYISREQAIADFKERHKDDQLTLQALEELGKNPLGATLNIKAKEPSQYAGIDKFLSGDSVIYKNGVRVIDETNFNDNKTAIERLNKIMDSARKLGLVITLVLTLLSVLITFNTIRLTIFVSREEIQVMQLVGASYKFIRGPFVVCGVLYGLVAGVITLIIFYPVTFWVRDATADFFGTINLFDYYLANFSQMFFIVIGAGVLIGALSSYLAVRRYLRL
ncbi:MAG TPA: permease-like cell division protein FtsX [Candidatus Paceibacterota bacterium]